MNKQLISLLALGVLTLVAFTGRNSKPSSSSSGINDSIIIFNAEVKTIIDSKCYGCHSNESKGIKSRRKLNWDSINLITRAQKANKLDDIVEVVSEDEMPPKKFLEKEPDKKLTLGEKRILENWADSELNRISKSVKKK